MDAKCLSCEYLLWWDGDYCCLPPKGRWKILAESKDGCYTDEVLKKLKEVSQDCKEYKDGCGNTLC